MKKYLITGILLSFLLSACQMGSTPPSATPVLDLESSPTPTLAPTSTPTPIPPTDTPAPTETPTTTPTPLPPEDYGPDNFPEDINPLTGLRVSDPALLERRPMAVKIQMFPRSGRPPWGISLADIVFDYYNNNGMTRFNAIFYGNDAEQVGPIRSGRLFDSDIIRMYKAIFAFGGAYELILNEFLYSEFWEQLVFEGSNTCPVMCRVEPEGYNHLVTDTRELNPYAAEHNGVDISRQNLDGMTFQLEPPAGGQPGEELSIRYSISAYTRWDYDPASGRYLRYQDTLEAQSEAEETYEALIDRLTNEQVAADNVLVIFAPHSLAFGRQFGANEIIDINLEGSGQAYAFRDGQVYQVKWNRPTQDSVLYLTYPDGSAFPYKQGITWYQVVGGYSTVEEREAGTWRFEQHFP